MTGLTRVWHSHWHISGNHLHEYQAWLGERSFCATKGELDQDLQGWFAILPQYSPMYLNAIWPCRWLPFNWLCFGPVTMLKRWLNDDGFVKILWSGLVSDPPHSRQSKPRFWLEAPPSQNFFLAGRAPEIHWESILGSPDVINLILDLLLLPIYFLLFLVA